MKIPIFWLLLLLLIQQSFQEHYKTKFFHWQGHSEVVHGKALDYAIAGWLIDNPNIHIHFVQYGESIGNWYGIDSVAYALFVYTEAPK
jgi:hypothetical protein